MEAVKIDSNTKYNSIIYSNMAAAYMRIGRFKEALEQCTLSLAKNSENLKALSRRIECLFKLQDFHGAIVDLEKLRRIDPSQELECSRRIHQAEQELSKQPKQDYYSILAISKDATPAQIKASYKKLALELHPDKYQGKSAEQRAAEYKFKLVVEAYGVLSDPDAKSQYDIEQFPTPFPSTNYSYPFSKGNQGYRQYEGFHQKENFGRYRNGNPWF
jgi:DnaJ family protein C protein 7